jgi:formylglycine-generating enzyme
VIERTMNRSWRAYGSISLLALFALPNLSCSTVPPARAQWRVAVRTDAPVPQLFDRLRVEVLDDAGKSACAGCVREFGLTKDTPWPVVFGVVPQGSASLRVRASLYRARATLASELGDVFVDTLARLPLAPSDVNVALRMACVGSRSDIAQSQTCDGESALLVAAPEAQPGAGDAAIAPGTALSIAAVPCAGDAPPNMACVAGGVYAFGDRNAFSTTTAPQRERLVRVSPFFIDRDEVTAGQVRALVQANKLTTAPEVRDADPTRVRSLCAFGGAESADSDDRSLNCVSKTYAADVCKALGKRLPTEAEWEFAAGNRDQESAFSWGDDPNICAYSVVSRGPTEGEFADPSSLDNECRTAGVGVSVVGPVVGASAKDATALGIRHLSGNLAEWVSDAYADLDEPCWAGTAVLPDPECKQSTARGTDVDTTRGGAWSEIVAAARSSLRVSWPRAITSVSVGFRCVKDAR